MAIILSKLIPVFLFPLGLSLVILAVSLICLWWPGIRRRRWGIVSVLIIACLLTLWMAGSPYFAGRLLSSLEGRYTSQPAGIYPEADAIVVLSGGVAARSDGSREASPGRTFDRLYMGYRLYQAGKSPVMILSGGGISWRQHPGALPEARSMSALGRQLGVPEAALIIESRSRNTRENAWYTRKILQRQNPDATILLVTSAFHMPRSRACFEKLDITVIPCPADFRIDPGRKTTILDFLPDAGALEDTTTALREYLGMVYYRLRGWI